MSAYNQRSWGSGPGDQPFATHSVRVLPTCRQEATPCLLPSAPSRAHCPTAPCLAQPHAALPHLGVLCSEMGRQGRPSLPGRQRLWKPLGSCVRPCDPRGAHGPLGYLNRRAWEGGPHPCSPALLV